MRENRNSALGQQPLTKLPFGRKIALVKSRRPFSSLRMAVWLEIADRWLPLRPSGEFVGRRPSLYPQSRGVGGVIMPPL
jgi:hypothetical protein